MGGHPFSEYGEGADVEAAFGAVVQKAKHEHGHGGCSGTIAQKEEYVVIDGVALSEGDARALAHKLIAEADSRIADKWGPAGAIAVRAAGSAEVIGWMFVGWANC